LSHRDYPRSIVALEGESYNFLSLHFLWGLDLLALEKDRNGSPSNLLSEPTIIIRDPYALRFGETNNLRANLRELAA
jgi:hypothetical protein